MKYTFDIQKYQQIVSLSVSRQIWKNATAEHKLSSLHETGSHELVMLIGEELGSLNLPSGHKLPAGAETLLWWLQ